VLYGWRRIQHYAHTRRRNDNEMNYVSILSIAGVAALSNIDDMSPCRPAPNHTDRPTRSLVRSPRTVCCRPSRRLTLGRRGAAAEFDKSDKGRINLYVLALCSNRRPSGLHPSIRPAHPHRPQFAELSQHGRPELYPGWDAAAGVGEPRGAERVIGCQMMPAGWRP